MSDSTGGLPSPSAAARHPLDGPTPCWCPRGDRRALAMSIAALEELVVITGQPRLQPHLDAFLAEAGAALADLLAISAGEPTAVGRGGGIG